MTDLKTIQDKPEARQFYKSILEYMQSDEFQPETKMTTNKLKLLFSKVPEEQNIKTIGNISYE